MRVYLDTMVWIYALEQSPAFGPSAKSLFERLHSGRHRIITSHLLLAEILVRPIQKDDAFTIAAYRHALLTSDTVDVARFSTAAALRFAQLRAAHRIKQPDAIHLALAASAHADAFVTVDSRLSKLIVSGIGTIADLSFQLP